VVDSYYAMQDARLRDADVNQYVQALRFTFRGCGNETGLPDAHRFLWWPEV